jgi:hypothetical protein
MTLTSGIRAFRAWLPSCRRRHHGYQPCQPDRDGSQCHDDASPSWVSLDYTRVGTASDHEAFRLDSIANSIASATFDVINEGKVRTADMGGKLFRSRV